jgi:hypothetical protein
VTLLSTATSSAVDVQVRRSGVATVEGTLVAIDSTTVEIAVSDQTHRFPLSEVLGLFRIEEPPMQPPSMGRIMVGVADGSQLALRRFNMLDQRLAGELADGSSLETPAENITSVLFIPLTPQQQSRWESLQVGPAASDTLVVRRDSQLDFIELSVGDVTDQMIECTLDGEPLEVKRARVVGILFRQRLDATAQTAPIGDCDFADGSRIVASAVSLENEQFSLTTPGGLELSYAADDFIQLDTSTGKIVELIDEQPLLVQYSPYYPLPKSAPLVGQFMRPRFITNDNNVSLQLDGVSYDRGIIARSRTLLRYAVPSGFARFSAIVGFVDHVRPQGLVHVRISGDEHILFDEIITGDQPSCQVALDLGETRQLTIEIDYGSDDDTADIVCICEARFEK